MGRKSKKRRARDGYPGSATGPGDGAAFEFVDDRKDRSRGDDSFVAPAPAGPETVTSPVKTPTVETAPRATANAETAPGAAPGAGDSSRTDRAVAPQVVRAIEPVANQAASAAVEPRSSSPVTPPEPSAPQVPAVPADTVGELLTTAREARGLSLEEASARTRIAARMLRHLENDRFGEFAAEAYARGFLRSYGSFLDLDTELLLRRYAQQTCRRVEPVAEVWEEQVVEKPARRRRKRRPIAVATVLTGVAILLGGGLWFLTSRGFLELRPRAGLEQIENELRDARVAVPSPPPTTPETVLPEPAQAAATAPVPEPEVPAKVVQATAEDTAPPSPAAKDKRPKSAAQLQDMEQEPPPDPPAPRPQTPAPVAAVPAPAVRVAAPAADAKPDEARVSPEDETDALLVLTATALDSCSLRVQVDADARGARRVHFNSRGETRVWSAARSFRVVAHRSRNLELRLNGELVRVPPDGRTLVIDRSILKKPARRQDRRGASRGSVPRSQARTASSAGAGLQP